jgi:hypothetical protein
VLCGAEASFIAQTWSFHVAEVDYTTTAGTKEGRVLQPALAVSEGAPNEKPVIDMVPHSAAPVFQVANIMEVLSLPETGIPSLS